MATTAAAAKSGKLPQIKVLAEPKVCPNGRLNWGIGETIEHSIFAQVNEYKDGLNRKRDKTHANKISESIMAHGDSLSIKVVIFKGVCYVVDGNHRLFRMIDDTGSPIRFSFRHVDSIEELVAIMIDHNCVAKNWESIQYVVNHATMGKKPYAAVLDVVNTTGLNVTIAAAIVANSSVNLAKKGLRNGKLTMDTKKAAMHRAFLVKRFFDTYIDGVNLKSKPMESQRMGEGLLAFIGSIGWDAFADNLKELAQALQDYTLSLKFVGHTKTTDFESALKEVLTEI